jgi:DNA-binding transcriptional MerR regulator
MPNNFIAIKDISKKFNITPYTINHYTNLGLLKVVMKNKNKRLYDENEVTSRLKTISALIAEGYPLQLIAKRLNGDS